MPAKWNKHKAYIIITGGQSDECYIIDKGDHGYIFALDPNNATKYAGKLAVDMAIQKVIKRYPLIKFYAQEV